MRGKYKLKNMWGGGRGRDGVGEAEGEGGEGVKRQGGSVDN